MRGRWGPPPAVAPVVDARAVEGVWVTHVPRGADLLGRASTPADGCWQRREVVPGAYLAASVETATAE